MHTTHQSLHSIHHGLVRLWLGMNAMMHREERHPVRRWMRELLGALIGTMAALCLYGIYQSAKDVLPALHADMNASLLMSSASVVSIGGVIVPTAFALVATIVHCHGSRLSRVRGIAPHHDSLTINPCTVLSR
jgi:hypothetical protein